MYGIGGAKSSSESEFGHALCFTGEVPGQATGWGRAAAAPGQATGLGAVAALSNAAMGFDGGTMDFGGDVTGLKDCATDIAGEPGVSADAIRGPPYGMGTIGVGRRVGGLALKESGVRVAFMRFMWMFVKEISAWYAVPS